MHDESSADDTPAAVEEPSVPAPSPYDSVSRLDADSVVIRQPPPARERHKQRVTSDVRTWVSLGMAIPLYLLLVGGAHAMPEDISRLLLERGWIPHVIMALSCWCIAILVVKTVGLKVQRKAFSLELLPPSVPRITPDSVPQVLQHIEGLRTRHVDLRASRSFLVERAKRLLEHFAARGDVTEMATVNAADADADAGAVASSFSLVKVLVWAIPILGFIGTVVGISVAVGGFSQSLEGAEQLDTIKSSLGEVTSGLAVAFDTTLVALVASILVMLPTSWVQKAEEQLVNDVDDFCVTHILRRLASEQAPVVEPAATRETPSADDLRQLIVDTVASPLAEMIAANTALMRQLAADHAALGNVSGALAQQLSTFADASRELSPQVARAVEQLSRATQLADDSTTMLGRTSDQLCRELGASRKLMQLLAAGMGHPAPHANGANGSNGVGLSLGE